MMLGIERMTQKIDSHKITKPIQLLAAWLTGLVLLNGSFLAAATSITEPTWIKGLLVIASVLNVPLFIAAIFLLQTKFRPEMQEDSFYSKYLENKTKTLRSDSSLRQQQEIFRHGFIVNNERLNSIVNESEEKLEAISKELAKITSSPQLDKSVAEKLQSVENSIEMSEVRLKKNRLIAQRDKTRLEVNNSLKNYQIISKRLLDADIVINSEFGANTPEKIQISFGNGVAIEMLRSILTALKGVSVDYLEYGSDSIHYGRIYIGSYAFESESIGARYNADLESIVFSGTTTIEQLQEITKGSNQP